MDTTQLSYTFDYVPGVMKRGRQVLLMVIDHGGKFVLGGKDIYPEGIVRFMGGGIEEGEDSLEAGIRELEEETGLLASAGELQDVQQFVARVHEKSSNTTYTFETDLYCYQLQPGDKPKPSDDLDEIVTLDRNEFTALVTRFKLLPKTLESTMSGEPFSWGDYGEYFGLVHEVGMEWWVARS